MRSLGKLVLVAAAVSALTYAAGCKKPPATTGAEPGAPAQIDAPPRGAMKAYVDPETGQLTDRPPPGAPPIPGDVLTPPGTVIEKPAPGGGVEIEPQDGEKPDSER